MRTLIAAAMIALMTAAVGVSAYAQGMGGMGGGRHRHGAGQNKDGQKKKKAEGKYVSPLERLPDKPYDPWSTMRGSEPANKTSN